MGNPTIAALFITGIGMPMLFAALALLIVTMLLLTALTAERRPAQAPPRPTSTERAAAIAVALARAEAEMTPGAPTADEEPESPWRQYHRQRVLGLRTRKSR